MTKPTVPTDKELEQEASRFVTSPVNNGVEELHKLLVNLRNRVSQAILMDVAESSTPGHWLGRSTRS